MGATILLLLVSLIFSVGLHGAEEHPAVSKFREYLRIPTNHPNPYPGYGKAIKWLIKRAQEIGLEFNLANLGEGKDFALWLTWRGSNPALKSVLLNSHMDVVAVEPEKWTYPPFEAHKDDKGNIYARGAGDMKCATVEQLEALQRLKAKGFRPLRTIHMSIMPDEEKCGHKGMEPFVNSFHFKNLNVGIDIDEGVVGEQKWDGDHMGIYFTEKAEWQFNITARGKSGHGSSLPRYTAAQRLQVVIDRLLEFREAQYTKLHSDQNVTFDQLTTLNLVGLGGGIGNNIIPSEIWASFDIRIRIQPDWNFTHVENMLLNIIEEARLGSNNTNDVEITYTSKSLLAGETVANDSNVWWRVLQSSCRELKMTCYPVVIAPASDGRYVRSIGITTFGVGPFIFPPNTIHQDNEYINEIEFLKGIDRYEVIIRKMAMVPESQHP